MYVYIESEPGLFTVGHYAPGGQWIAESDHTSFERASERVALLNGNKDVLSRIEKLEKQVRALLDLNPEIDNPTLAEDARPKRKRVGWRGLTSTQVHVRNLALFGVRERVQEPEAPGQPQGRKTRRGRIVETSNLNPPRSGEVVPCARCGQPVTIRAMNAHLKEHIK